MCSFNLTMGMMRSPSFTKKVVWVICHKILVPYNLPICLTGLIFLFRKFWTWPSRWGMSSRSVSSRMTTAASKFYILAVLMEWKGSPFLNSLQSYIWHLLIWSNDIRVWTQNRLTSSSSIRQHRTTERCFHISRGVVQCWWSTLLRWLCNCCAVLVYVFQGSNTLSMQSRHFCLDHFLLQYLLVQPAAFQ